MVLAAAPQGGALCESFERVDISSGIFQCEFQCTPSFPSEIVGHSLGPLPYSSHD